MGVFKDICAGFFACIWAAVLASGPVAAQTGEDVLPDIAQVWPAPTTAEMARITQALRLAVILSEDSGFDDGFHAYSPLTAQVVRRGWPGASGSFGKGIAGVRVSVQLANIYSHDEIIALWVRDIYVGHGCFGVERGLVALLDVAPDAAGLSDYLTLTVLARAPNVIGRDQTILARGFGHAVLTGVAAGLISGDEAQLLNAAGPTPMNAQARCIAGE